MDVKGEVLLQLFDKSKLRNGTKTFLESIFSFGMDVKGEVLLQLFNISKLRNGTKTFLESIFSLFIVKFKKLGFSAPLATCLFV